MLSEEILLYKLEYLPAARKDLIDIAQYISKKLQNPEAANRLATRMIEEAEKSLEFPYANPAYLPIRPLRREYRKILVQNYLMFYWINEESKTVTIARVVYAKRNHEKLLD